jgi:hypothetical protein
MARLPPNIILPRLENSSCWKRSSDSRLSLGISVVRGVKALSCCWNAEEVERREPSMSPGLLLVWSDCGGGTPAFVGDLGDLGPFSEPHGCRIEDAVEGDTGGLQVISTVETDMFFFRSRFGGLPDEEKLKLFNNILSSGFVSVRLVPTDSNSGNRMISVWEGMAGSSGGVGARRGRVYGGGNVEGETLGTTLSGFSKVSPTEYSGFIESASSPSF